MPTNACKAKHLLKQGKAKVVKRTPFTIQLLYPTGEATQNVTLGVDAGYKSIGLSATTESKELYSAEIALRNDMVKLNSERRMYRRSRRGRKCWHRKPRFLNRAKPEGWLAPSIQHKLDSHVKAVGNVARILPVSRVVVEVANFDIQKIKSPEICGDEYQQGDQYGFSNVREYVFYRDDYTCRHCHGKSRDPVLQTHHIVSRQVGGDRPENMLTLCKTCHDGHHAGEVELTAKPRKGFKTETFMTTVRWKLVLELREAGYDVTHTYGYMTKSRRIEAELDKSHANDAFVIAGGSGQARTSNAYFIKQVRKCNRKLYRGDRSHIRNTAPRFVFGFQRYDKVLFDGIDCFVMGRRSTGYFCLKTLNGEKIQDSAKHKDLTLLECASTWLTERRTALIPALKDGVSGPRV